MLLRAGLAVAAVAAVGFGGSVALGDGDGPRPLRPDAKWTTVFKPPAGVGIEGLTADRRGDLYVAGRAAGAPLPGLPDPRRREHRGRATWPRRAVRPGLAFGPDGRLYVTNTDRIEVLKPDAAHAADGDAVRGRRPRRQRRRVGPATAALWVSRRRDRAGPRVADRARPGAPPRSSGSSRWPTTCVPGGVGRDVRGLPPGTITITDTLAPGVEHARLAAPGGQRRWRSAATATLYVADTARGAIWRVYLDGRGRVRSPMGCDTDVHRRTRCAWTPSGSQHPVPRGRRRHRARRRRQHLRRRQRAQRGHGRDPQGRACASSSATRPAATRLRNEGPLEFPTSPVLVGRKLCLTHSDGARRDNFPNAPGEGAKVSCVG